MASHAVNLLKENSQRLPPDVQKNLESRFSIADTKKDGCSMYVEEEEAIIAGEKRTIRRLFAHTFESDYGGVGWVINEDIKDCMICHTAFGVFRWPHHCRSCGNLVCHPCSPDEVVIEEMKELGPVRICVLCYFGQDPVHIQYHRLSSFSAADQTAGAIEDESQILENQRLVCHKVFIVRCTRLLDKNDVSFDLHDRSSILIHLCLLDEDNAWPDDRDFVVRNDVERKRLLLNVTDDVDEVVEIHHAIMRADVFPSHKCDLEKARTKQVADSILGAVARQFSYKLLRPMILEESDKYHDSHEEVFVTKSEIDKLVYNKLGWDMQASVPYVVEDPKEIKRKQEEEQSRRLAEEEAAQRLAKEAEARRLAEDEEARRQAEEARRVEEEEARRLAEEEEARRLAEEEARRLAAEEEARRVAEEEEARRLAEEEEARRLAEEEEARRLAAEEEARRLAEEEARRLAEEEEARRLAEEEEARRLAEEEEARRLAEEEEARRLAEEEEARRLAEEEEARRLAEEEEARRLAEEEARRVAEEEEARRLAAEEEARRLAEEEEARRLAEEEEARRLAAEEEARRLAEEEDARRLAAEEEARRLAEEEARRFAEEAEAKRVELWLLELSNQAASECLDNVVSSEIAGHCDDAAGEEIAIHHVGMDHVMETAVQSLSTECLQEAVNEEQTMETAITLAMDTTASFVVDILSHDACGEEVVAEGLVGQYSDDFLHEEALNTADLCVRELQAEEQVAEASSNEALQNTVNDIAEESLADAIVEELTLQQSVMASLAAVVQLETSEVVDSELHLAQHAAAEEKARLEAEEKARAEAEEKALADGGAEAEDDFEKQMELATQFRSTFAHVAGKGFEEESQVIDGESDNCVQESVSHFVEKRTINAILVQPNPWVVIKSKLPNGGKVFINLCHHPWLPLLPSIAPDMLNSAVYQEYLQLYFVQFTLNKVRHVMHVGELQENVTDKEKDGSGDGGKSQIVDVSVHSQVYLNANRDPELADKMFVKVIKAVGRRYDMDLDVDYKLPRTLKNYKGQEVALLKVDAYPPMRMKSMSVSAVDSNSSSATKTEEDTTVPPEMPTFRPSMLPEVPPVEAGATTSESTGTPSAAEATPAAADAPPAPRSPMGSHRSASMTSLPPGVATATTASTGGAGAVSPTVKSTAPQRASFAAVNHEWNTKWSRCLRPGANVVYTSPIIKRNRLNLPVKRQLILTDEPKLFYVDASSYAIKGEIEWSVSSPPNAVKVKEHIFDIATAGRTYRMEDQEKNAERWVNMINNLAQFVKNSRK